MGILGQAFSRIFSRYRHTLIYSVVGLLILMSLCACSSGSTASAISTTGTSAEGGTNAATGANETEGTSAAGGTNAATGANETAGTSANTSDRAAWLGQGPGGPLRIWWTQRDNFNPLQEKSKAGQAVNDLIFQGLFRIREDQSIEPQLARNLTVWQSGLQVLVIFDEGHRFHDGSLVTLDDAAACISYIINPANQSIYAAGLSAVESVQVIDQSAIVLQLRRPDPWIAYALTFPIIPAASLDAESRELVPGSGPYRMVSFDADIGLRLLSKPESNDAEPDEIIVRMYDDQLAAMRAMERDELDLVYLDARDCSRYMQRSNLRLSVFPGNELFLTLSNPAEGRVLAEADQLVLVKQMIQASSLTGTEAASWGELTSLGIPDGSWLASAFQADSAGSQLDVYASSLDRLVLPGSTWQQRSGDREEPLQIIVAAEDERRVRLAQILAERLAEIDIPVSVVLLTVDLFWPALESGSYDLAVLTAVLPNSPDPAWLYRPVRPEPWSAVDRLNAVKTGLDAYADWQDQLIRVVPGDYRQMNGIHEVDPAFADTLVETAVRSPWSVHEILAEGLAYGDRVYGQCKPNRYHPYQNVEELWVWSGQ